MKEIFKDIPKYEGIYQVSNLGRIKSLERNVKYLKGGLKVVKEKILKTGDNGNGYLITRLSLNGKAKTFHVHQLVAAAFLNHTPNGHAIVIDHIDTNKSNNELSNLQLITQRENLSKDKKGGASKYTGAHWFKNIKKWGSSIRINGKLKHLGCFKCELEASAAYQSKLKEILTNQIPKTK